MKTFSKVLTLSVFALLSALVSGESNVIVLNDNNFEANTQAASGATTGPWFVKFYAPWCGHCQKLEPTWEDLAAEFVGRANIAKIDVTENLATGQRFKIKGFPTLIALIKGKMYKYEGRRGLAELSEFIDSGYQTAESEDVPPELNIYVEQAKLIFNEVLELEPQVLFGSIAGGFLIGGIIMYICLVKIFPAPQPVRAPATKSESPKEEKGTEEKKSISDDEEEENDDDELEDDDEEEEEDEPKKTK